MTDVNLTLQPATPERLLSDFQHEMTELERGLVSVQTMAQVVQKSLVGRVPPELDGALWLNSDGNSLKLKDLRGKYVFLDFWTTWCGPCPYDMPSVRMLSEFYHDQGLAVIGVHDNSVTHEQIREHVEERKLPFPTVVDHADGRILRSYRNYGVTGYSGYLLIGPDGRGIPASNARKHGCQPSHRGSSSLERTLGMTCGCHLRLRNYDQNAYLTPHRSPRRVICVAQAFLGCKAKRIVVSNFDASAQWCP